MDGAATSLAEPPGVDGMEEEGAGAGDSSTSLAEPGVDCLGV